MSSRFTTAGMWTVKIGRFCHLKYLHFELHFMLGCGINEGCFMWKWAKTTNKVSLLAWFCFYTDIANNSAEYLWGWDLSLSISLNHIFQGKKLKLSE